jgi:hypothetical protein
MNAFSQPGMYWRNSSTARAIRRRISNSALVTSSRSVGLTGSLRLHLMNMK